MKILVMKAYNITKLSDNVQYRNEIIYVTVVVLFWCRRSIATVSTALTSHLDLLGVGQYRSLHERKKY